MPNTYVRTQSFEQFWQTQLEASERTRQIAQRNLAALALRDQPRLFEMEAEIIELPPKELGSAA